MSKINLYKCKFHIELEELLDYGEKSSVIREDARTVEATSLEEADELFDSMIPLIEKEHFDSNYYDSIQISKYIEKIV